MRTNLRDFVTPASESSKGNPKPELSPALAASSSRWLLLIHQIPPKPDYLRVKIGRRLQRVGAIAIKNSVYVLPPTAEALEDFQWIVREIADGGGDAFVSESSFLGDALTDDAIRARFNTERDADYGAIIADARLLLTAARRSTKTTRRASTKTKPGTGSQAAQQALARLRRRYETVRSVDFFAATDGVPVVSLLSEIEQAINAHDRDFLRGDNSARVENATWVTRRDIHVDRVASAWLIRRFIDAQARFRFVDATHYQHHAGELRFDMFEGEYTHVGDECTFETLLRQFALGDSALRAIGEIVHDVDCKDSKYRREEAPGVSRMIDGIATRYGRDDDRLERGVLLFDDLYAAFTHNSGTLS